MKKKTKYYFQARFSRYVVEAPNVKMACLAMVDHFDEILPMVLLNRNPELESIIYCPNDVAKSHLIDEDYEEYKEKHFEEYHAAAASVRRIKVGERAPKKRIKKKFESSKDDWFIEA